jgi:hypothetical protein
MTDWCTTCGVALTGLDYDQCINCDVIAADPPPTTLFATERLPVEEAIRRILIHAAKQRVA